MVLRNHLPDETIKENHPEVSICFNGERHIDDPNDTWFEFTGKKAGRTKVGSPKEKENCEAYVAKYELMKERARMVLADIK